MPFGRTFWTTIGNTTWFIANTSGKAIEVFKSDGTTAGTVQVTHGNGVPESQFLGPYLGTINGRLIYGGIDSGGEGVFALDTNGGEPVLLGRFVLRYLANGVVRGDALYFYGPTTSEHELWRTDGTPAGTSKIDLMPGNLGAFDPDRDPSLFALGQWIFFYGVTPQGTGLHRTDGTIANTTLLLPLSASALFNDTSDVIPLGDRMLFSLRGTQGNNALWATDGTAAGTLQIATVKAFTPIGISSGKLFFDGGGLWTTDGTAAGTRVTDVNVSTSSYSGRVLGNRLFLIGSVNEAGKLVPTLYVSEGTAATTRPVMKLDQHGYTNLGEGFVIGNNFYFRHDDGIHGLELWRTDGTTTELLADINPGYRTGIEVVYGEERPDGKVIFVAEEFNTGREPWITDGTAAGTHLLANCSPEDSVNGSSPTQLRASGERVFFVAHLAGGQAIGISDGTSAGTSATLVDFSWTIASPAAANARYFFSISTTNSPGQVYATDGTAAGTTPIFEQSASPHAIANGIVFAAGRDLWFSDGTLAATRKNHTFGASSFSLTFFSAGELEWITQGSRLWTTDGTEAGTVELIPSQPPTGQVYEGIRSGKLIYFIEDSGPDHGKRLWRSDGSAAGTTIVRDLGLVPAEFVGVTDGMTYLNVGGKLYRSDGTESGTIELPVSSPCIFSGAAVGDALVLTSFASNGTLTVWRSDGTVTGTTQLAAMPAKDPSSGCKSLAAHGSAAYFSGWDAVHGWELWMTDGTSSGTKMLADIYPGIKSSLPAELTVAGDRIFFSADSPNIGRELWAVGGHSILRRHASRP
jgi:ELWxxDGT repeat protein